MIGLRGMAGVGKTALALRVADSFLSYYSDAQIYIDLMSTNYRPLSTHAIMEQVARVFYPEASLPENRAELAGLYHTVLYGKRTILFIDNASSAEQIAPLIPSTTDCLLLVTSRRKFTLPGLFSLNVEVLTPDDSRDLLKNIAPNIAEYADYIAELCGHLPLALCIVGSAAAKRPDLEPMRLVQRLTRSRMRLEFIDSLLNLSGEPKGVEASFNLSYDLMDAKTQSLWSMLAVFQNSFDREAARIVWDLEADLTQDILSKLVNFSLLDWIPSQGLYRLNEIARLFASIRLSKVNRMLSQRRYAMYSKLSP